MYEFLHNKIADIMIIDKHLSVKQSRAHWKFVILTWYRTLEDVPMNKPQVRAVMPRGGMSTAPSATPCTLRLVTPM